MPPAWTWACGALEPALNGWLLAHFQQFCKLAVKQPSSKIKVYKIAIKYIMLRTKVLKT